MLVKQFGESDHLHKKEFWVEDNKAKRESINEKQLNTLYDIWSDNDLSYRADRGGYIIFAFKEPIELDI